MDERINKLTELAKPLIKYINEEWNPHVKIIIDCSSVELLSGEISNPTIDEFIKD